jgi:hypothetical protein
MRYVKVVNSIVVNAVESNDPLSAPWVQSDTAEIGYLYDDGVFRSPVVVQSRKILTTDFWKRFPMQQRIQIRNSTDDVVIEWLRMFDDGRIYEIDLDDSEVIEAMNYFVSVGLLTASQAATARS